MPESDIGGICICEGQSKGELFFGEILLDETLAEGTIWVRKEALRNVGGINGRLKAKRIYETVLRIAKRYTVLQLSPAEAECLLETAERTREAWICLGSEYTSDGKSEDAECGWLTDCYVITRYKKELLDMGCFEDAVLGLLASGGKFAVWYLERMLAGEKLYWDIFDSTQPILIYIGGAGIIILVAFCQYLGKELEGLGQKVEYFDLSRRDDAELAVCLKKRYKAVVGMNEALFSVKNAEGALIHDSIPAPQYNFIFDHPVWFRESMRQQPQRMRILTLDNNYARFIERYYGYPAKFLPPGGEDKDLFGSRKRKYEVSFLGTIAGELLELLKDLRDTNRKQAYFINRYVLYMRKHLGDTPEYALERLLEYYGITYTDEEFLDLFYNLRWWYLELAGYYRGKVIRTLLEAGIVVHVFGDTWKNSPVSNHPLLIQHEEVAGQKVLEVYAESKISLNIMKWHKDAFTERIANGMLQKSVVVTDRTAYLEKNFVDGEDILLFDLDHLKELPARIMELLADDEKREWIAENGYRKVSRQHTWRKRAEELMEMIREDREEN